ncbi:MAG: bifunctional (p)ppGpp synthetase/guanosine-3',5'-bis(diphosphate) 3'-pyrophosphohydrolase [Ruminococcaceae bacterium]|nr:bifunctional (p)ppGpp synthetase/guanosine-3',5'-bis(diphosphate) 3'-pyrophosphohydrolase [Oscillospiraceae bacterium]
MYTPLEELIKIIKENNVSGETDVVEKAYNYAVLKHEGQLRKSGEEYVNHPIAVAKIIAEMGLDTSSVAAALLHDVVEDTDCTDAEMEEQFGETIALLVCGVTKLSKIPYTSKEEQQVENLRKMFLAMAQDVRVIVIKLADRLHNLRTMKSMPEEKQREKARETLEVYAPLAHRLGMSKIKWELEDLSLRYIDPIGYYEIVDKIAQKRDERESFIKNIMEIIEKRLGEIHIKGKIEGRAKHFYSIYRKMFIQNKSIDELYDLFAVRVIVDSDADCYAVLGMVHELFKPIPGRFKDYIAMPKPNMYQSLHSTVIGPDGTPFEIQIRTWEMHRTAENGIAAHWKYKEGKSGASEMDKKLEWIKQLLEIQKDMANAEEFMQTLKIDMFSDEVFVFTPKGDVVSLPAGSTPIDFAYAIHSAVGNKMSGAKINGKIVNIDYKLINGDIIEIITSNAVHGPNLDWLKIAKTSQARNKINQFLRKENRSENIVKGKEMLERDFKKLALPLTYINDEEFVSPMLKKYGFKNLEDMYATLGYGGSNAGKFVARLKDETRKLQQKNQSISETPELFVVKTTGKSNNSGIIVDGIDNCLVRLSKCCNPVPGDHIVGFITRGRGVAVHRTDCINMTNVHRDDSDYNRFIGVRWADGVSSNFLTNITISANDRNSLVVDISTMLYNMNVPLRGMNARATKNELAVIDITIEVSSGLQLQQTIKGLQKIDGVLSAVRRRQ